MSFSFLFLHSSYSKQQTNFGVTFWFIYWWNEARFFWSMVTIDLNWWLYATFWAIILCSFLIRIWFFFSLTNNFDYYGLEKDGWQSRWVKSDWKKSEGKAGSFKHTAGKWAGDPDDKGNLGIQFQMIFCFLLCILDEFMSSLIVETFCFIYTCELT